MSNTLFLWPVRVYCEDTDPSGVVYHARYIALYLYERACADRNITSAQFYQCALLKEQVAFAVRRVTIEYFSPAHLDNLLNADSEITVIRGASITFAQRILNSHDDLLSQADLLIAFIDPYHMKPIALPKSIVAEFKQ
ncbi:MAG: tol-pal system-associated acyl-CoA thioesterase [Candidatus Malihini olakiniferum]